MSGRVWLSLARSLPGILSLVFSGLGQQALAAWSLVVAVWADAATGWLARRLGSAPSASSVAMDGVVDCLSFVAAPACFALRASPRPELAPAIAVFVAAGLFRLARFQVEGLVRGGYRGLPVTYNGYIFPAAALLVFYEAGWDTILFWHVPLLLSAGLMVGTFRVPEV
jgi:phosphatidylserine synthase